MKNKKIVLVSETGYSPIHDKLLESLLDQGYELFCAVGTQCQLWEEIMDEIAVGDGSNPRYISTTSHPGETESEVIEFAEVFSTSVESGINVIRI